MTYLDRLENIDVYFLFMATVASWRATCRRRRVGYVLVDDEKHVKATGYNGVPRGFKHCLEQPCPGAEAESGTNLDECYAAHAETNAYQQLGGYRGEITAYGTTSPCRYCAKLVANTNTKRLVVAQWYPDSVALDIIERVGIKVEVLEINWELIAHFMDESMEPLVTSWLDKERP